MSTGRTPRAYVNDVPTNVKGGSSQPPMEYVADFTKLGIGARSSGLPKESVNGIKSLDHVGGSAGGRK